MATNAAERRLEARLKLVEAMEEYYGLCISDDTMKTPIAEELGEVITDAIQIHVEVISD